MTKVLNLDELETQIEKVIVIDGVSHNMTPFSVEQFIEQMREIVKTDPSQDPTVAYEASLRMIERAFPSLPNGRLRKMNTHQIDSLFSFIKGEVELETENGAKAAGE